MGRRVPVQPMAYDLYEVPPEPEGLGEDVRVRALAEKLRIQKQATDLVKAETAAAGWTPPWSGGSTSLADQLTEQRPTEPWLVERLMGWHHNIVLAAQHGSGKTTLGQNLLRSLVDQKPFLGRDVTPFEGRVGWINGEMNRWDWLDYIRPMRIRNTTRIATLHLEDGRLPLLNDAVREQFAKWCSEQGLRVLMFDSWRRLCAWSGLDENVNADVERMTMAIDEVKRVSGVHAVLILAHTGRAKAEEGEERARGATALDDWVGGRWVMVKQSPADGGKRFMFADKRGVFMEETALEFDPLTYRITLGEGNRRTVVDEQLKLGAMMELKKAGKAGLITKNLAEALGVPERKTAPLTKALAVIVEEGMATLEKVGTSKKYTWIQ